LGVIAGELATFPACDKAVQTRQAASVRRLFEPKELPLWTKLLPGFGARCVFKIGSDMAAELLPSG
jgi:hypothetical protein